jgi:type II secretory pathway component PulM
MPREGKPSPKGEAILMRMISLARTRAALAGIGVIAISVTTAAALSLPASAQTLVWSVVPSPSRGLRSNLNGVSCILATSCTAAGTNDTTGSAQSRTLIESGVASG